MLVGHRHRQTEKDRYSLTLVRRSHRHRQTEKDRYSLTLVIRSQTQTDASKHLLTGQRHRQTNRHTQINRKTGTRKKTLTLVIVILMNTGRWTDGHTHRHAVTICLACLRVCTVF